MASLFICFICFSFRIEDEDEVFNIGREFDELYHWHSLRPLSDDFERTKADECKNVYEKVLEVDHFLKRILKPDGPKILQYSLPTLNEERASFHLTPLSSLFLCIYFSQILFINEQVHYLQKDVCPSHRDLNFTSLPLMSLLPFSKSLDVPPARKKSDRYLRVCP